ncbi:MAG: serine hydrolase [Firmicutes bacterium]|nr:serine hydrolase [Bacillota bacterium]
MGLVMAAGASIDETVRRYLRRDAGSGGAFAGAVIAVAKEGRVVLHEAWGAAELFDQRLQVLDEPRPMRPDTFFDLASVTKVAATTLALAALVDDAGLSLEDALQRFLPETAGTWLGQVELERLLTHRSGLPDWLPFYLLVDLDRPPEARRREAVRLIARLAAATDPGPPDVYSDLNFILLGQVVERVAGEALDAFVARRLYRPLGLSTVGYQPPAAWRGRIAATSIGNPFEVEMCRSRRFPLPLRRRPEDVAELREPRVLVGRPNDGNCRLALGGVSGHAGLFADALSLVTLGRMVLDEGTAGGTMPLLRPETVRRFTRDGLGWRRLPWSPVDGAYGHTGFTGTLLHIDPAHRMVVAVLTNRVHGPLPYVPSHAFLRPILQAVYGELTVTSPDSPPTVSR